MMTEKDCKSIFKIDNGVIRLSNGIQVTINDFLEIAGFKECNPTKEDMLVFDSGTKGYKKLIESGDFE